MPDFPTILDNTILSTFKRCPFKCYVEYFLHRRAPESWALTFGKAYAQAHEEIQKHLYTHPSAKLEELIALVFPKIASLNPNIFDEKKTPLNLIRALVLYYGRDFIPAGDFQTLELSPGQPAIEISFANFITEDILYGGRFDRLITHPLLGIGVYDDKTTARANTNHLTHWSLSPQFLGYIWGAERVSGLSPSFYLIREAVFGKNTVRFQESLVLTPKHLVSKWLESTRTQIEIMRYYYDKTNSSGDDSCYFPQNFGDACNQYGACCFKQPVCRMAEPVKWAEASFPINEWKPAQ